MSERKIKVQFTRGRKTKSFWVKEKNPFFSWYKSAEHWRVLREVK